MIIGGVDIPFGKGLLGHSDADVLCHAIADALLGAADAGDIGRHFPDASSQFKGISSLVLLGKVGEIIRGKGFGIVNLDSIIVAERPKMAPHAEAMKKNIAGALEIEPSLVGVKATSTEGLGFAGKEEGIASYATALLRKLDSVGQQGDL